jgi:hypothetical protein
LKLWMYAGSLLAIAIVIIVSLWPGEEPKTWEEEREEWKEENPDRVEENRKRVYKQSNSNPPNGNSNVPADSPSDDPGDYDAEGNYKPVEGMTQEEIEAELIEILEGSLNGQ